jgi:molecular chaperone Hsp33
MNPRSPSRPVSDAGRDDIVVPFLVEPLSTRGRVVRLGPAIDAILKRHAYPDPIARIVGEAAALTVLLGSALKREGSFQLQTKTDGVVNMLIVDFDAPSNLRALARFDADKLSRTTGAGRSGDLLGAGHLALTIDPGAGMSRYQGVIGLDGQGLEEAAHQYFQRSEQIPTLVRLAVGEIVTPTGAHWRAGGLMAQFLPDSPERRRRVDLDPGDAPAGTVPHAVAEDDAWVEGRALVETVEDLELLDPDLSAERVLYRLFHERGVRVFRAVDMEAECSCSRASVESMLQSFPQDDRDDMVENGVITVTCEFCNSTYVFQPGEVSDPDTNP